MSQPKRIFRWTAARKRQLVLDVCGGSLTEEQACEIYNISAEEFAGWRRAVETDGVGLKCRDQGERNRSRAARFQQSMAA